MGIWHLHISVNVDQQKLVYCHVGSYSKEEKTVRSPKIPIPRLIFLLY